MFSLMRERDRERNIYQLPPVRTLTRNQTHNFLAYRTTLQSTDPPGRDKNIMRHQRGGGGSGAASRLGTGAAVGGAGQGHGGWAKTRPCAQHSLAAHSSFQGA